MIQSVKKIGKVRKDLALILSQQFNCEVNPAYLKRNRHGYWQQLGEGWSTYWSWYYDSPNAAEQVSIPGHLDRVGCRRTMGDVVQSVRHGKDLVLAGNEIMIVIGKSGEGD